MSKKTKELSPTVSKPTLLIDSRKLRGNSFKVGKQAKVMVSGRIIEESLNNWEVPKRKSFRLEIDKISSLSSGGRSSKNRFGRKG
jgi:hypothetical protein